MLSKWCLHAFEKLFRDSFSCMSFKNSLLSYTLKTLMWNFQQLALVLTFEKVQNYVELWGFHECSFHKCRFWSSNAFIFSMLFGLNSSSLVCKASSTHFNGIIYQQSMLMIVCATNRSDKMSFSSWRRSLGTYVHSYSFHRSIHSKGSGQITFAHGLFDGQLRSKFLAIVAWPHWVPFIAGGSGKCFPSNLGNGCASEWIFVFREQEEEVK